MKNTLLYCTLCILPAALHAQTPIASVTKNFTSNWVHTWNVTPNKTYVLKVSGEYADGVRSGPPSLFLDAAYDYWTQPAVPYNKCPSSGSRWRFVDDCAIRPVTDVYTTSHVYYYRFTNTDGTVDFDFNDGALGDNSGSLTFELFQDSCGSRSYNPFSDVSSVCGDSLVLDAGAGYPVYAWSDGATGRVRNVRQSGLYKIAVTDTLGCRYSDSIRVSIVRAKIRASDTSVDGSRPVTLYASQNLTLKSFFNGSRYFEMPSPGPVGTTPRTISYWVKTPSQQTMGLLSYGTTNTGRDLFELCLNLNIGYGAASGNCAQYSKGVSFFSTSHGLTAARPVSDDQWHHIAYVTAANGVNSFENMRIYVDGRLVTNGANGVNNCGHNWGGWQVETGSSKMQLGRSTPNANPYTVGYSGQIDELGIWSGAFDSAKVRSVMERGVRSVSTGLLHHYDFDSLRNDTLLLDLVGGNHGVARGASYSSGLQTGSGINANGYTYKWSTGDTTASITVTPTVTTTYYLTVSDGITSCRDSITIRVCGDYNPLPTNIYSRADSVKLDAGPGMTRYRWSTGDSSQAIHVKYTGPYKVTVLNASGCTTSDSVFVQFADTLGMHVATITGNCNQLVEVPVKVSNFRNMLSMQGSINWNPTDLAFDSISAFGPASMALNASNFGTSATSVGRLAFSWSDYLMPSGRSLPDSTTLFTLRFNVLTRTVKTVPITITSTPTPLEFIDGQMSVKKYLLSSGGVTVNCEFTLSGKILTPIDQPMKGVTVALSGAATQSAVTDTAGNYRFKLPAGNYVLTPSKTSESNKANGVTTLDLLYIQAHILQRIPFNSAYKAIAADANNSASVSSADIVQLRRLILGTDTTLPNNRIWAFVDGDQTFATPSNAFPFNSTKTLTNQTTDISHTFRAIKIGDVNYDRNPQLDEGPSGDTLRLFYSWTDMDNGEVILTLRSRAFEGIMGWQGTLRWDARKLELLGTTPMMPNLGTGDRWKGEGSLTLSWNDPRAEGLSLTDGVEWLKLRFRKTDRMDRTTLGLSEERLMTEAFNKSLQRVELRMQAAEMRGNAWEGSMRVYPNPVQRVVNVEWKNANRGEATVRLLDATGRTVYVHRGTYEAGMQKHVIRRDGAMASGGNWIVQVEMDGEVRNRTVVMLGQEPKP